jgi:glycosyltransferase involved in cell wall biosynthesis
MSVTRPRISVVTAVRNGMPWIQDTVHSVLAQRVANLEYIVLDGASTDGTAEWLASRRDRFAYYHSRPDAGQYAAIAEGLSRTSGDVMGWINGDDMLMPWALQVVEAIFAAYPDVQWVSGQPAFLNAASECIAIMPIAASYPRRYIANGWFRQGLLGYLMQETMFWRRSLWEKVGGLDLQWDLAADFDLWMRFAEKAELTSVAAPLGAFRLRGDQNRSRQGTGYHDEVARRCREKPRPPLHWRALAACGRSGQSLLRLMLWRSTPLVCHSLNGDGWQLLRTRRPISRNDVPRLLVERSLARTAAGRRGQR